MARGKCRCCGSEYNINADGTIRYHLTDKPEYRATPDSRKCAGVGVWPVEERCENCGHTGHGLADRVSGTPLDLNDCSECNCAREIRETDTGSGQVTGYVCRVPAGPEGCGRPVQLTANGRARSHLDNQNHKCGGGSDWPLQVLADGTRRDTRPVGEVLPAAAPEDLRFGSEDPVEDFLGTGGLSSRSSAEAAGDGRTAAQQEETDRRMADPVGTALERLLSPAVGNPGTVLGVALGFDPQDPDGPGEAETHRIAMDQVMAQAHTVFDEAKPEVRTLREVMEPELFDETHDFSDPVTQTYGVHPGPAESCTEPGCCQHPQGFTYVDDDNGHCGDFCPLCGAEPPEPCRHDYIAWDDWDEQNGTECIVWACKHCRQVESEAVTRMLAHDRARCTIADLDEGVLFRRHTARPPMDQLVYRAGAPAMGPLKATVVTAGPYAGRTGSLTNMGEEITCTDLDGRPRPRRGSGGTQPPQTPQTPQRRSSRAPSAPAPQSSPIPSGTVPGSKPGTKASAPGAGASSIRATASGPTEATDTSATSAEVRMTTDAKAAGDFLAAGSGSHGEAEAKYGRWGRYKLTHPATGKTVEWTRATTFAKSISDTFTLSQWGKRNVLVGATMRADIVAAAHGKDVSADREQLNTWTEELEQAAGSKVAANLGTAVHSFTEAVDRRWAERWTVLRQDTPEEFRPHVEAYILLLEEHGLEPVPHMIEFSTGVLQYEVMGTSDNCYRATKHLVLKMPRGEVRLSPGEHVIGDKKTGKDLDYGWQEICIQLALYAQGVNTQGMFNWADMTWDPDPLSRFAEPGTKVREDVGVILHLPVDPRSKKRPALHGVDLESGWNAAVLCERVRAWRKVRTLAGPVAVVDMDPLAEGSPAALPPMHSSGPSAGSPQAAEAPRTTVRPPTFRERAEAVTSRTEASQVYQDAVAAKVPVAEAKELIAIMSAKIAQIAEPGGAKV